MPVFYIFANLLKISINGIAVPANAFSLDMSGSLLKIPLHLWENESEQGK